MIGPEFVVQRDYERKYTARVKLSSATKTWSPETDGVPPDLTVVWDYCTWKKTNETVYISFVCCTLRK